MECREAREFFSPYLDGELTTEERDIVRRHLAACPACREEMARWEELSRALRELKAPVAAPPGFAAAVMARVNPGRQARSWWRARRLVAAAAAVVLLIAGSVGYAARGLWQQLPASIAALHPGHDGNGRQVTVPPGDKTTSSEASQPGAGANPGNLPGDGTATGANSPAGTTSKQSGNGATAPGNGQGSSQPAGSGKNSTTPGSAGRQPAVDSGNRQPAMVAGSEPYPARTFLSAGRQVASTMLKLEVTDMAAARAKALGLGGSAGATAQVIAVQDNGQEKRFICQFTVAEDRAAVLLAGLKGLGQVISQNTSTQDLTQQFSATLEQYQAKVAQVNAATDPAEKEKLTREAKALEQQLTSWDDASKKQVIILWLETQ
ncbi:anti-sigma-W factor RsiW [Moorella thermoacetica]|uniref:Anti-sigma-W factor RsiW n=1 Tax=Neomoorella thermoacetica TaxID=1525 RepID=A0A1J5NG58_NEOTH|nr:anti-sigma-W factor RsiW [Moorella thermoacetica]